MGVANVERDRESRNAFLGFFLFIRTFDYRACLKYNYCRKLKEVILWVVLLKNSITQSWTIGMEHQRKHGRAKKLNLNTKWRFFNSESSGESKKKFLDFINKSRLLNSSNQKINLNGLVGWITSELEPLKSQITI